MLPLTRHYVYKTLSERHIVFICSVIFSGVLFCGNASLNEYALYARESDRHYLECEQTCASSTGSAQFDCLRVCISTKKRMGPVNKNNTKEKMITCEDACKDLNGLENVRCVRKCIESK